MPANKIMMKRTKKPFFKLTIACCTTAMLFVSTSMFSQKNAEEKMLLIKANELVYSNPDETIKIVNHLLKAGSSENASELNLILSNSYITKGDYNKSVNYIFDASANAANNSDSLNVEIGFIKAELSRKLHLYKQMDNYLLEIGKIISKSKNKDYKASSEIRIDIEKIYANVERKRFTAALNILNAVEKKNEAIEAGVYNKNLNIAYSKALIYRSLRKTEISEDNYNKAFSYYKAQKMPDAVLEAKTLMGLGQLFFERKEYAKSINTLLLAQEKAKNLSNLPLQAKISNQLAYNYLGMEDKVNHQRYFGDFLNMNKANMDMENEAVNSLYNRISHEQDAKFERNQANLMLFTYIGFAVLIILVVLGAIVFSVNKAKRRRLKEIIGYLEVTDKLLLKTDKNKKEPNKKIAIPTETEHTILAKLKKFENSTKYTHKDMSLATLAAQLDVNTKYLSEIINKHYHDNFNTYINRLRINYIIEKLKNEPEYLNYKISYLAEESGFSSHSSFATVFKTITGIAPTVFIDLIGKEVTQKKA